MSTIKKTSWLMWLIASLFLFYQFILRVMPNVMFEDILSQFSMNTVIFGQFSGIYYIGYSLAHIPIGIMLDRYSLKKVLVSCVLLTIVGLLPILFAKHWIYPTLGRLVTGIGSSGAVLGLLKIIRISFDEDCFSRMLGFSVTIGLIGAIYGGGPVKHLCKLIGYQNVVTSFVILGLALMTLVCFVVPNTKSDTKNDEIVSSIFSDIKTVFSNYKVVIICFSSGLLIGPLEGFTDAWGVKFLNIVYGIEGARANYISSMVFVGACIGSSLLSLIAEKTNYLGTIIASGVTMFVIFVLLLTKMLSGATTMIVGFIIIGICCGYQILSIYKISTYVTKNVATLASATANMVLMIFGYIYHGMIGGIIKMLDGTTQELAFCYGISIIPVAIFLGIIGFSFIFYRDSKSC